MKKTLLALFAIICGTASAQVGWTFPSEVKVVPGGTATFTVTLDDETCTTYQGGSFYLSLPEGFSVVEGSETVNADRTVDHDFDATYNESQKVYNCVLFSSKGNYLKGTSGPLVSLDLKCDESVLVGEYTATITRSSITYYDEEEEENGKVVKTNISITIIVGAAATSVDITLANEWNTYCYDKSLDFSGLTDVTAYEVTEVTPTSAKLSKLEKVYAGQGFIIKGTAGAKITVPFAESCDPTGDNKLVGVTEATSLAAGNYILCDGKFVKSNGEGELGANKAYLPASEVPSSAKSITFDFGETTGINEVQKAETDGAIYNLSGMRVSKTQKGVYIMNGRKVIVK
jgi:hypothetical protein